MYNTSYTNQLHEENDRKIVFEDIEIGIVQRLVPSPKYKDPQMYVHCCQCLAKNHPEICGKMPKYGPRTTTVY